MKKYTEKELLQLIREVEEKSPNGYQRTLGMIEGLLMTQKGGEEREEV